MFRISVGARHPQHPCYLKPWLKRAYADPSLFDSRKEILLWVYGRPLSIFLGLIMSLVQYLVIFPKCWPWFDKYNMWVLALKMASGETIHRSYECLPLLGIFLGVINAERCWRLVKLSQSFSDIFHNSFTWHKIVKICLKNCFRLLTNI